jgi:hypothetical protein
VLRGRWGNVAHRLGEFSTSGENAQDNDLIMIREAGAAAQFEAHFARMREAAADNRVRTGDRPWSQ